MYTSFPMLQSRPMWAPSRTWAQCQIDVPSPISASGDTSAEGWIWRAMASRRENTLEYEYLRECPVALGRLQYRPRERRNRIEIRNLLGNASWNGQRLAWAVLTRLSSP